MKLATVLKQLREENGLVQKELAVVLHVSNGTISNYESGIHSPNLDTLCTIADLLSAYFFNTLNILSRILYSTSNINVLLLTKILITVFRKSTTQLFYIIYSCQLMYPLFRYTINTILESGNCAC